MMSLHGRQDGKKMGHVETNAQCKRNLAVVLGVPSPLLCFNSLYTLGMDMDV